MNYDIELNANDSSVLETQYAFTQGDYGQIQFSIRVKADGTYVTNAQRAYIVFTLPNGYVVIGADMSKSVATYTYPFQGSELQVPGIILADVKLVYTDGQISSNKFSFICRYDPLHDKSFSAGPYISQLQQIIDEGQDKIDYLQSLIEILQTDVGGTPVMRSDLHNTRDAVDAGLKAIDANMAQNILLKSENDANKIVAADSLYAANEDLQEQITTLNSNLTNVSNRLVTAGLQTWSYAELQSNAEKSANWNDYNFLMIGTGNYSNIWETITVPTSYFANSTSSGGKVVLKSYDGSTIEVYKTSTTAIKVACYNLVNEQKLWIFGAIPKQ